MHQICIKYAPDKAFAAALLLHNCHRTRWNVDVDSKESSLSVRLPSMVKVFPLPVAPLQDHRTPCLHVYYLYYQLCHPGLASFQHDLMCRFTVEVRSETENQQYYAGCGDPESRRGNRSIGLTYYARMLPLYPSKTESTQPIVSQTRSGNYKLT